eukprot:scaffold11705_cov168-Skeletonema_dohrnii-CCMP3373.AAC.1
MSGYWTKYCANSIGQEHGLHFYPVQLLETGVECSLTGWLFWLPSGSFVISRRAREWSINSINRAVNEAKNIEWEEGKALVSSRGCCCVRLHHAHRIASLFTGLHCRIGGSRPQNATVPD